MSLSDSRRQQIETLKNLDQAGFLVPSGTGDWMTVSDAAERARRTGATGAKLQLVNGLSKAQIAAWRKYKDQTYFLVRNDGALTGERWRCARMYGGTKCNMQHDFYTCMCVPLPFKGLDEALYAFSTTSYDHKLTSRIFEWAPHLQLPPNLATLHPQMARALKPENPGDEDIIAVALGTLDPIDQKRAQDLASKINFRRPPQRVRM